jgi:hypothetical protein
MIDIKELAKDLDFAIDVTEPREVILARFEEILIAALPRDGAPAPVPAAEQGRAMTTTQALALFAQGIDWLRSRVRTSESCSCGACYLCAYRTLEAAALPHAPSPRDDNNE